MTSNPDSILDSTKKLLGFDSEYTAFDLDITMFINAAFGSLQQLGVGGDTGFQITDNTTLWSQYVTDVSFLGMVKSFIFMSARLAFDPPGTSFGIDAFKSQLAELTWRINVAVETLYPPLPPALEVLEVLDIFDGGIMKEYFAPKVKYLDWTSTVTIDASLANVFYLSLDADTTILAPINGVDGEHVTLSLTSNGFSVTWGNGWNFGNAGLPQLTSGGRDDIISSVYKVHDTEWHAGYSPGF
jgi:hypothetical protein